MQPNQKPPINTSPTCRRLLDIQQAVTIGIKGRQELGSDALQLRQVAAVLFCTSMLMSLAARAETC